MGVDARSSAPAAPVTPRVGAALTGDPPAGAGLTGEEVYAIALAVSGDAEWASWVVALTWCEARWRTDAVGVLGEQGLAQVRPDYHGAVPPDAWGQIEQLRRLHAQHGPGIWSCA